MVSDLLSIVNSDISKTLDTLINEVKTLVNTVNGNVSTINTNVNSIKASNVITYGAVKSVQRGTVSGSSPTVTVTVSSVNPAKCLLIVAGGATYTSSYRNGGYQGEGDSTVMRAPTPGSVSATSISVTQGYLYYRPGSDWVYACYGASWQLIEFY